MLVAPMTTSDYRQRLQRAAHELQGNAMLLLAAEPSIRNASVEHIWRQESFFNYLCGFNEPESALLLLPFKPEGERVVLFLRENDAQAELWDGPRYGLEKAKSELAVDIVLPITSLWDRLPDLLGEAQGLYCTLGAHAEADRRLIQALGQHKAKHGRRLGSCKLALYDAAAVAGRLRLCKQPEEVARLRAAASITRKAFAKVYASVQPGLGMTEKQVHGLLLGEFIANGADMEAYGSIVAGGANACVLHYRDNNKPLRDDDLLLIDAGAQYDLYASDVTRTFPVGRRFSPEQKAIYEITLEAQKHAIAKAVVGSNLPAIHDQAIQTIVTGLIELKLLKGSQAEVIEKGSFRKYFPHGTSHWIGMDVHDVGVYFRDGKPVALEPGMYFSVEPGIYISPNDDDVPPAFRGIGVRIEDDILVTAQGPDVITTGIAKDVSELENRF